MPSNVSATPWRRALFLVLSLCAFALITGCSDDTVDYTGNYGEQGPTTDNIKYDEWVTYKPDGAICADGTQYKFFVKRRKDSQNVLVLYEGGGACWSYDTCTGSEGSLGALGIDCVLRNKDKPASEKVDCISDDYADTYYALPNTISDATLATLAKIVPPFIHLNIQKRRVSIDTVLPYASSGYDKTDDGKDFVSPMHDWNLVFVPYCTADLYSGDNDATYVDEDDPSKTLEFHHVGLRDVKIVAKKLNNMFPKVPKFAMNGCSAGGAGVMATYPFYRTEMKGIEHGYVFSDAGPFFPTAVFGSADHYPPHSRPLHEAVIKAWNIDSTFNELIENYPELGVTEVPTDVSELYGMISDAFPEDRFNLSFNQTDYNYSLYSYTGFYGLATRANNAHDAEIVYKYWRDDFRNLIGILKDLPNFGYYFPYWRRTNNSHCLSIVGYEDVDTSGGDAVKGLMQLLSKPVEAYYAGTHVEQDGNEYSYHSVAKNLLDNSEDPLRIVADDAPKYMGLRKYCTPKYLYQGGGQDADNLVEVPGANAKCECAFGEWDKVDSADPDNGQKLCGCLSTAYQRGNELSVADCQAIIDDPRESCDNTMYSLIDPENTDRAKDICACLEDDTAASLEDCETTVDQNTDD